VEIRTLERGERDAWLDLLNGWELPDGWSGREFFRRWIELDPTFRDENVWVVVEAGRLVSTVQIFPREVRVLSHGVPTGGIGSVYTRPDRRRSGIAGAVLERVIRDMRERGMELSLLFGTRFDFYGRHGWLSWKSQRAWVRRRRKVDPPRQEFELSRFERERDLVEMKALGVRYSDSRSGTVLRDDSLWEASFALAGNPAEEIVVARQGDELVAYLRLARMSGHLIATELARGDDAEPLAALIDDQLQDRDRDVLADRGGTSDGLRRSMLLPSLDDTALVAGLESRGISARGVDDPENMLQCLDVEALAARLQVTRFIDEAPSQFLQRVLPPERFVFWPADRF